MSQILTTAAERFEALRRFGYNATEAEFLQHSQLYRINFRNSFSDLVLATSSAVRPARRA